MNDDTSQNKRLKINESDTHNKYSFYEFKSRLLDEMRKVNDFFFCVGEKSN